ncbi:hypothetical protein MMC06_004608 [Schaereria dolodes]|nr:hypothetical protein [Schaereria dolodes]
MAALHSALQVLSPTSFSNVPSDDLQLQTYIEDAFSKSQILIDSVPPPLINDLPNSPGLRSRANTATSSASGASEMSASSARSDPPISAHAALQKEWGKPIKLSAKENPLGMGVYKLSGKDGRGAWFSRRSVHEGLGFTKWKLGLQREFPESLEVQGGPGEGNIRGIGGEKRVVKKVLSGVGTMEVYHLSAQFPGPTTPRDFVTLLLTSSSALTDISSQPNPPNLEVSQESLKSKRTPRHFMVISKPCEHPDCPPREGFIRGQYESIEFIREVPPKPNKSSSATDLGKQGWTRETPIGLEKEATVGRAQRKFNTSDTLHKGGSETHLGGRSEDGHLSPTLVLDPGLEGRARGRTISFAESRGVDAKGEVLDVPAAKADDESEMNPVEWIMITRSDPGGSVPRFMVERGTPSGIVADASKFLNWACKKEHPEQAHKNEDNLDNVDSGTGPTHDLEAYQTNGRLAGLDRTSDSFEVQSTEPKETASSEELTQASDQPHQGGIWSSVTNAAYSGLENYAPQAVINRLPAHQQTPSSSIAATFTQENSFPKSTRDVVDDTSSTTSTSSIASFDTAEDHLDNETNNDDMQSNKSTPSSPITNSSQAQATSPSQHEKELTKLADRKRKLDEKLTKTREKELKDKEDLTSKEKERLKKVEEKHAREVAKAEEKHSREMAKLQAKRVKEAQREEERRKRAEDKDEKAKLLREREEAREELEVVKGERDLLRERVGELQMENTTLVARIGKLDGGGGVLRELREELSIGRPRSSSGARKALDGIVASKMSGVEKVRTPGSKPSSLKGD